MEYTEEKEQCLTTTPWLGRRIQFIINDSNKKTYSNIRSRLYIYIYIYIYIYQASVRPYYTVSSERRVVEKMVNTINVIHGEKNLGKIVNFPVTCMVSSPSKFISFARKSMATIRTPPHTRARAQALV
jgi:hypothetical protein